MLLEYPRVVLARQGPVLDEVVQLYHNKHGRLSEIECILIPSTGYKTRR